MSHFSPAVLQINLNMLDLRAIESGVLLAAAKNGVGIIARTPLNFGFLSGNLDETVSFTKNDHRSRWSKKQIDRWCADARAIRNQLVSYRSQEPSTVAIRFCLSYSEVATTIPGMMFAQEVLANIVASEYGGLEKEELDIVSDLYNAQSGEFNNQ